MLREYVSEMILRTHELADIRHSISIALLDEEPESIGPCSGCKPQYEERGADDVSQQDCDLEVRLDAVCIAGKRTRL